MVENLYERLGVKKDATADTIRDAYRKLARKHHPDVNPGNKKAEDAFKSVSAAYEVLSDAKRRAAYDEFGDASLEGGFDADKAREYSKWQNMRQQRATHFDQGPTEFDFSELFGRSRGPARGRDMHATVMMGLREAIEGAEVSLDIPEQGVVRVRIPPGADHGSVMRIPGKGTPGARGGPHGDLVITVEVAPHPWLRRDGLDLKMTLPVDLNEAYNGARIEIPTFDGTLVVKVPALSQNGATLRLRGKGIKRKESRGDLLIELEVRMPDQPDEALAAALQEIKRKYSASVRGEMVL